MSKTSLEGVDPAATFVRLGWDLALQRLFSTFPNHWPGVGLLLMRLSLGVALIYLAAASLLEQAPAPVSATQQIVAAAAGILLILGLWTPLAATLAALDQIWIVLSLPSLQRVGEVHILLGALCASAAMLGPGAWSVDARLFGRRRFPTHQTRPKDHHPKG